MDKLYSVNHVQVKENYIPEPLSHMSIWRDSLIYINTLLNMKDKKSYLDIGTYDGWLPLMLAEDGCDTYGVEWVCGLVMSARRYAAQRRIKNFRGICANWFDIEFDFKFDVASAYDVLECVPFVQVPRFVLKMERYASRILLSFNGNFSRSSQQWGATDALLYKLFENKKDFCIDVKPPRISTQDPLMFISYSVA